MKESLSPRLPNTLHSFLSMMPIAGYRTSIKDTKYKSEIPVLTAAVSQLRSLVAGDSQGPIPGQPATNRATRPSQRDTADRGYYRVFTSHLEADARIGSSQRISGCQRPGHGDRGRRLQHVVPIL